MEDMRLLGVAKPDMLTRVSEYTDKIVIYIETIIEKAGPDRSRSPRYVMRVTPETRFQNALDDVAGNIWMHVSPETRV
jgi:hypothetical protein